VVRTRELFVMTRPWSFPMTVISVTTGSLLAYYALGSFNPLYYVLAVVGSVLLHAAANVANDYFDTLRGVDKPTAPTARYRPHPVFTGMATPGFLVSYSVALAAAGLLIGAYLSVVVGPLAIVLGAIGAFLALTYSGPPLGYKYHALGEPIVFTVWGPIMVLGGYYVEVGSLSLGALAASIPLGLLVAAVLLANNIRDEDYDRSSGVTTIATMLGREASLKLYYSLILSPYIVQILVVAAGVMHPITLVTLLSLPKAWSLVQTFRRGIPDAADPMTAQLVLAYGILLLLGLAVSIVI